jgi:hypothetical protein
MASPAQRPEAAAVSGILEERHRRLVARLIWVVYFLLIFEGVLRKWLFPHWGKPLFFIRDPFVLSIYALVLMNRTRLRTGFLEIGCLFGIAGLVLVMAQRMWTRGDDVLPLVLQANGWRSYFFYLPLAFVIGRYLNLPDLKRLLDRTLYVSVAMAGLAVVQFTSAPLSPINAGTGDSPEELYRNQGLPGGFVRPFGTFTSSVGMSTFTVSVLAIAISLWLEPRRSRSLNSYFLLLVAMAGPLACLSLSGSRGALVSAGLVVFMAIGGLFFAPGVTGLKAVVVVGALIVLGAVVAPVLFPKATQAFTQRWEDAGEGEQRLYGSGGVFGRAIYDLFSFRLLMKDTPPQGFGLGSAGNAAWNLGTRNQVIAFTSAEQFSAAETDWGRHILELGPALGLLFILFRIGLTVWLGVRSLGATMRSGHPLPWLLFTFVGIIMFNGQITANGTMNAYGWLFTGFCLAATNSVMQSLRSVKPTPARRTPSVAFREKRLPQPRPVAAR